MDNQQTEYKKIDFANPIKPYHIFFNRGKRKTKFILDTILDLIEELKKIDKKEHKYIPYSLQYLILLNLVVNQVQNSNAKLIQFKISEQSYTSRTNKLIFQSYIHNV